MKRRTHRVCVLGAILASATAHGQPADDTPDPTVELSAKLAAQQKTIDDLIAAQAALAAKLDASQASQAALGERLSQTADAEARARADAKPVVHSAWPHVTVGGFLQVDASSRQSSSDQLKQSGDPLNQDRFYIRRARPKLVAAYGRVGGILEIDINTVNGGQVRPSAVEATYRAMPWLEAGLGIAKIPFGFEVGQSDRDRLFLERSNAERGLFPGEYDVGARIGGAWKFLRYAIAVQNGEPVGEKTFTLRDPNQGKDITARAGIETKSGDVTVAGGFSFLTGTGFHAGTPATKDTLVWRDLNEDGIVNTGEIQVVAGQATTPSANFDRFGIGADLELTVDFHDNGKLMVYGEVVAAGNLDRATVIADPVVTSRDFRELGWYVAAIHEPTPWSAIGMRFDMYDPDADASELRTGAVIPVDQKLSTFALTGALKTEHGRLILEYDHNRNHSGRTMTGVPTNLSDDAVTLRAEVQL